VQIRHAITDDVAALATLAEKSFRHAFAGENRAEDVDAYVSEAFSVDRLRGELSDRDSAFLLACDGGGHIEGYAKLRAGLADDAVTGPDPFEIERLYADPAAIGLGIGAALMRACLDEAAARGYRTIWLGVWVRNARAISFYERWGFRTVGSHQFTLGADQQIDLIMERPVDLPARE
jgi:ribosomal protein S18 acetylase RimI-like enzyme